MSFSKDDCDIVDSPGFLNWQDPVQPIDCGNSGTTARLLLGLCASRPGGFTVLFGDQSLSQRPWRELQNRLQKSEESSRDEPEAPNYR